MRLLYALEDLHDDDPGMYAALVQRAFALLDRGYGTMFVQGFLEDSLVMLGYL